MRPLILTALLMSFSPAQTIAQTMPTIPHITFPEDGTFCDFLTLCPKVAKTPNEE